MSPSPVMARLFARPLIGVVKLYRVAISPWLGANCRFDPSCSAYAIEALETHGAWRGSVLTLRRLSRCHPWGGSGYDPVPTVAEREHDAR
ncbi:MAG: membrane protein insertion efficiency factor YidD [Pseudomonadota bacterium]